MVKLYSNQFSYYKRPILSHPTTQERRAPHLFLECRSERRFVVLLFSLLGPKEVAVKPVAKVLLLPGDLILVAELIVDLVAEALVSAGWSVAHVFTVGIVAEALRVAKEPLAEVLDVGVARSTAEIIVDVVAEIVDVREIIVRVFSAHALLDQSRKKGDTEC